MRENFQLKNMQGITLIALVITIIVLLILATVTIRALIGDEGLFTKVKEAKTSTQVAGEKEQILLAVNASWDTDGELKAGVTKANLLQIRGTQVDGDDFPFTVTYDDTGNSYQVSGEGRLVEELTLEKLSDFIENDSIVYDSSDRDYEGGTKMLKYIGELYYYDYESGQTDDCILFRFSGDGCVYAVKNLYRDNPEWLRTSSG